jgi:hypothetical protein
MNERARSRPIYPFLVSRFLTPFKKKNNSNNKNKKYNKTINLHFLRREYYFLFKVKIQENKCGTYLVSITCAGGKMS